MPPVDFLNERKENYLQSIFDEDKSNALFENAKNLSEKREELLVQAFTLCPWNAELLKYIFIHFPKDRKAAYAVPFVKTGFSVHREPCAL